MIKTVLLLSIGLSLGACAGPSYYAPPQYSYVAQTPSYTPPVQLNPSYNFSYHSPSYNFSVQQGSYFNPGSCGPRYSRYQQYAPPNPWTAPSWGGGATVYPQGRGLRIEPHAW